MKESFCVRYGYKGSLYYRTSEVSYINIGYNGIMTKHESNQTKPTHIYIYICKAE